MATIIQLRRGDASEWTACDPVLQDGEVGIESDTSKLKIGDGVTDWTGLTYVFGSGSAGSSGTSGTNGTSGINEVIYSGITSDDDFYYDLSGDTLYTPNIVTTGFTLNSITTAPSTTTGTTFTNKYGGATNTLGDPTGWLNIKVGSSTYKIPYYL